MTSKHTNDARPKLDAGAPQAKNEDSQPIDASRLQAEEAALPKPEAVVQPVPAVRDLHAKARHDDAPKRDHHAKAKHDAPKPANEKGAP